MIIFSNNTSCWGASPGIEHVLSNRQRLNAETSLANGNVIETFKRPLVYRRIDELTLQNSENRVMDFFEWMISRPVVESPQTTYLHALQEHHTDIVLHNNNMVRTSTR